MIVRFTVPGEPVPQGSMFSPKGTTKMFHSKKGKGRTVPQWRKDAQGEAREAMKGRKLIDGAVTVSVTFYLTRPVSRQDEAYPDRTPDLDKLCRALGDALEKVVLTQDSRIVRWHAPKLYADDHPQGIACTVVDAREVHEVRTDSEPHESPRMGLGGTLFSQGLSG